MAVTWQDGVGIAQMSPDDMWRQAQAEYEARAAVPRNDAFGRTLQADTPDALREELFAPLQEYTQALVQRARPVAAERPFQFHQNPLGEVSLFNPNSGQMKILREGRQPRPILDDLTKSTKGGLEDRIKQLNAQLIKAQAEGDEDGYAEAARSIQNYQSQLESLLSPNQSDPFSQDFGQPGKLSVPSAFIGGGGQPNQMEWGATPGTAFAGSPGGENMFQPAARPAASNAPKSGEVRNGYRYNGGPPGDKRSWEKVR